jgi:hypothetical protein
MGERARVDQSETLATESVDGHPAGSTSRGSRVASALLALSRDQGGSLNPYLRKHLSGHVASARTWPQLAADTDVLDALDISALTSDVLNTSSGWNELPVEIAGTVANRHLVEAHPRWFRQVAAHAGRRARSRLCARPRRRRGTVTSAGHLGSTLRPQLGQRALVRHTGPVLALAAVPLPDGRVLLATGSGDRTVRLRDPTPARRSGFP